MNKKTNWAIYNLTIGKLAIKQEDEIICTIKLAKQLDEEPIHTPTPLTDLVAKQIEDYLTGIRTSFDFPYQGAGTLFQQQVWSELCKIPYGETRSYKEIANALRNPKACRAVGAANRRNPLLIVIPCHRVIGENGMLTGYAAGMKVKEKLLELEKNAKLLLK